MASILPIPGYQQRAASTFEMPAQHLMDNKLLFNL
jgi:hypothetical protein